MNRDALSGALLLALAAVYYWGSLGIAESSLSDGVGARGLPTILAALLAVIALALLARGLLARTAPAAVTAEDDREAEARPPRALGLLAIGAGYVVVAPLVGYAPALTLLIIAVALYEGLRFSWRLVATAVAGALLFWLLFVHVLGVEQPASLLFWRR